MCRHHSEAWNTTPPPFGTSVETWSFVRASQFRPAEASPIRRSRVADAVLMEAQGLWMVWKWKFMSRCCDICQAFMYGCAERVKELGGESSFILLMCRFA